MGAVAGERGNRGVLHAGTGKVGHCDIAGRAPAGRAGAQLTQALAGHRNVGEVRGDGMLAAVEFVQDRDDRVFFDPALKVGPQVASALADSGVIGRAMPQGDILGFAPPLCLRREEADTIVAKTADAVNSVLANI